MDIFNILMMKLTKILNYFNGEISSLFRELKMSDSLSITLTILAFSFIYGVIHALGPGHGKVLISSYLISNNYNYKKAFKLGYMISIIHALSALSITLIIYFLLNLTISKTFNETSLIMNKVSGSLIVAIGLYLIYEVFSKHSELKYNSNKKDFAIALSAGIVPCPGVMTLVLFSIIISKVYVGIISAILMSIGMGFTISIAGILTTKIKNISIKKVNHFNIGKWLQLFSAFIIIFLGIFLISK